MDSRGPISVSLFFTCMADAFYPGVCFAATEVLERFGVKVNVPLSQTCCGQPAFHTGNRKEARIVARKLLRSFPDDGYIVTPSCSCATMVRDGYPVLFRDEPRTLALARSFSERTYELSRFLVDVLGVTDPKSPFAGKVTYHESCRLPKVPGSADPPRTLLRAIPGLTLVEMEEASGCCGFGGVFSIHHPQVSCAITERKIERILATGAACVTSADLGCLLNLAGMISRYGYPVKALHLAEALQAALGNATGRAAARRAAAVASFPGFEAARERASGIRRETLSRLDAHLARFVDEAEKRGAVVHVARDAAQARGIAVRIAKEEGIALAVRSKSTAAEEISLDDALREAGIEEAETDLGGYVARLAGEPPSHILSSAFHMTRKGISRVFEREFGEPPAEGIPELAAIARKRLAGAFSAAGMGVSGANFLVADTGSVVLVSNDGNVRAGALLPRVHLAVAGIEKVLPRMADLPLFLRLLSRSATGQPLPSYVSFLTGPRREGDAEGPERLHILLIDCGRSAILEGKYREALKCIRCGACLGACPVYRCVGGRPYGWVYPGPIGSVLTPLLAGLAEASTLPDASTLCGACANVCPVKVPIPSFLLELRADTRDQGLRTPGEIAKAKTYASIMKRAGLLEALERLAGEISRLISKGTPISGMPYPFAGWTERRDFPAAARRPFRKLWKIRRGTRE